MKTQMTQSFSQYSENETVIWRQNILNQFNRVSSSCLRSHFVISLLLRGSSLSRVHVNKPLFSMCLTEILYEWSTDSKDNRNS